MTSHTHLDYVTRRWNKIYDHLKDLMIRFDYSHVDKIRTIFESRLNDKNQKIRIWHDRYIKQIIDFHHATFHLNFVNQHIQMTQSEQIVVLRFMKRYIDETKTFKQVRKQFFYMKFQQHDWTNSNDIWIEKKEAKLFWFMIMIISEVTNLSRLTRRVFDIFVNSIFSKRAFSIMNFIHNKHRNRLIVERFDMLQFIFMNDETLYVNKNKISSKNMLTLNDDDELRLENMNRSHEIVTLNKHSREKNDDDDHTLDIQSTTINFVSWLDTTMKSYEVLKEFHLEHQMRSR